MSINYKIYSTWKVLILVLLTRKLDFYLHMHTYTQVIVPHLETYTYIYTHTHTPTNRHTLLFRFQAPLICISYQELHFCLDYQLSPKFYPGLTCLKNLYRLYMRSINVLQSLLTLPWPQTVLQAWATSSFCAVSQNQGLPLCSFFSLLVMPSVNHLRTGIAPHKECTGVW